MSKVSWINAIRISHHVPPCDHRAIVEELRRQWHPNTPPEDKPKRIEAGDTADSVTRVCTECQTTITVTPTTVVEVDAVTVAP